MPRAVKGSTPKCHCFRSAGMFGLDCFRAANFSASQPHLAASQHLFGFSQQRSHRRAQPTYRSVDRYRLQPLLCREWKALQNRFRGKLHPAPNHHELDVGHRQSLHSICGILTCVSNSDQISHAGLFDRSLSIFEPEDRCGSRRHHVIGGRWRNPTRLHRKTHFVQQVALGCQRGVAPNGDLLNSAQQGQIRESFEEKLVGGWADDDRRPSLAHEGNTLIIKSQSVHDYGVVVQNAQPIESAKLLP